MSENIPVYENSDKIIADIIAGTIQPRIAGSFDGRRRPPGNPATLNNA
jgi:hypothetical protein